jgi:hypothetical protein
MVKEDKVICCWTYEENNFAKSAFERPAFGFGADFSPESDFSSDTCGLLEGAAFFVAAWLLLIFLGTDFGGWIIALARVLNKAIKMSSLFA